MFLKRPSYLPGQLNNPRGGYYDLGVFTQGALLLEAAHWEAGGFIVISQFAP